LNTIDELAGKTKHPVEVGMYLKLISHLFQSTAEVHKPHDANGLVVLKYSLQILLKLMKHSAAATKETSLVNADHHLSIFLIQSLQREDK